MIIRPLGEADLSGILELNRHLNPKANVVLDAG